MKTLFTRFMAALLTLLVGPAFAHGDHAVSGGALVEFSHRTLGLHELGTALLLAGIGLLFTTMVFVDRFGSRRKHAVLHAVGLLLGGLGLGLLAAG